MRRIPLRRRDDTVQAYALVDDEDYEELSRYRWHLHRKVGGDVYVRRHITRNRCVYMHRQVLGFPCGDVDHKDRNGLNNQRHNLRLATKSQNAQNRTRTPGASGYRGVYLVGSRFIARVRLDGVLHNLGRYDTAEEAAAAASAFRAEHMPYSSDASAA